ncbi:MAG: indolepyruvate oxidoreductase subunit beta [Firmicutes bacterium]|nr:indolepyruvate oxidoreductase subunit beta [Bacillota bacterium]
MKVDIVIGGVGGQGSVLASRALARAAMAEGLSVRTSEVIGMAQREGMVTSHVRMGKKLYGAIIPDGAADYLVGLELAETVRNLVKLRPGGTIVASTSTIVPPSVYMGLGKYQRDDLLQYIKQRDGRTLLLDASDLAGQAGSFRAVNAVLLGALAGAGELPFSPERLLEAVLEMLPEKLHETNRRAFELGRRSAGVF